MNALLVFLMTAAQLYEVPNARTLEPGEVVKVLTVRQWRALEQSGGPVATMAMIMVCESNGDTTAIGAAGERGAFQVTPRWWGPVPADLEGQALQAAAIMHEHGDRPWTTRHGCDRWTKWSAR